MMSANVYVEVTLSVYVGNWSDSATFKSLLEQAKKEALQILAKKLEGTGVTIKGTPGEMSVVLKECKADGVEQLELGVPCEVSGCLSAAEKGYAVCQYHRTYEAERVAKEALQHENQRIAPVQRDKPRQGLIPGDCYVCGQFGGHGGLPCPSAVPTNIQKPPEFLLQPKAICCVRHPNCVCGEGGDGL